MILLVPELLLHVNSVSVGNANSHLTSSSHPLSINSCGVRFQSAITIVGKPTVLMRRARSRNMEMFSIDNPWPAIRYAVTLRMSSFSVCQI